jgi:predicted metal-dependent phosphoesterase TrpH
MRIELHCHSTCSDGDLLPGELASRAAARGVELFCLTDHDTVAGYQATVEPLGPARVLRGLELSCREYDRSIHVLVYALQEGAGMDRLQIKLDEVRDVRTHRLRKICQRLGELGHPLDAEAILSRGGDKTPGRPDVARALVEAGVVSSMREAFTRFLRDGGPADVPIERLSVADGLELIRDCGGRASLAHPHTLDHALVKDLFQRHRHQGLTGIEAFYGRYGPAQREGWLRLGRELDLVATGGSDFHGATIPEVTRPGIDLPIEYAEPLLKWLGV